MSDSGEHTHTDFAVTEHVHETDPCPAIAEVAALRLEVAELRAAPPVVIAPDPEPEPEVVVVVPEPEPEPEPIPEPEVVTVPEPPEKPESSPKSEGKKSGGMWPF